MSNKKDTKVNDNGQVYYQLVMETKRRGRDNPSGRMTVMADTREQAMQGMKDVMDGTISMKTIPKIGLDLRTPPPTVEISGHGDRSEASILQDLLGLVGLEVPIDVIKKWNKEQEHLVRTYASAVHLKASDNKIIVPVMPQFLRDYQIG